MLIGSSPQSRPAHIFAVQQLRDPVSLVYARPSRPARASAGFIARLTLYLLSSHISESAHGRRPPIPLITMSVRPVVPTFLPRPSDKLPNGLSQTFEPLMLRRKAPADIFTDSSNLSTPGHSCRPGTHTLPAPHLSILPSSFEHISRPLPRLRPSMHQY